MLVERIKAVLARIKTDISTKVSKSGDTLTGKLVSAASSAAGASLNIPMGAAPSNPVAGDLWRLSSGFRYQNDSNQTITLYDSNNLNWGVLGYTPVQQGTGIGQTSNIIKMGWSASSKLRLTVDNADLGNVALESWVNSTISSSISGKADVGGNYPSMSVGTATNSGNANTVGGWGLNLIRDWGNLLNKPSLVYPDSGTYPINITGTSGYSINSGNANTVGGYAATDFWRNSQAASGSNWYKFPNGLIVQFFTVYCGTDSTTSFSFPTAFPSTVLSINANGSSNWVVGNTTVQAGLNIHSVGLYGGSITNDGVEQTSVFITAYGK